MLDTQSLDQMSLKFSMYNVIENMGTHYKEFLNLTTLKRLDVATYAHLLNVSILSMYFSSRLGLSKEDCLDIGIAALFHDIGKLYVSRKIIRKSEKLTEDEYGKLKSHPVLGSQILLKYVDSLGILPVVVCFEHHMKFDLSGYPKFPYTKKPHMASLIVSICDVYDALSQRRGYKRDYSPDLVHNIMAKDMTGNFDPQLIDRFFNVMGVWPIGSVVALSDGNIAIVRDENEDNIYYPKVEVIHPLEQRGLIDLKERKGSLKIERSLNPWKEGKFYLDQFSGQQKRV
jgi:HD-GYP domain-containing protein (c-di-GMP phosphodiesterase class II)